MFLDITLEGWDRSTKKFSEIVAWRVDSRVSGNSIALEGERKNNARQKNFAPAFSSVDPTSARATSSARWNLKGETHRQQSQLEAAARLLPNS
jgi:hypothetical protein